ncbi:MAG TPA: glycerol-3-phosphate 1-O-acyltransferase PlsY [Candidatus Limnocylindria bacterium]|nr:glycerol-3-phosphate 1-O-acyltransferase PlsY [Candidatus Limnocylindria bacterium]
MSATAIVAAAVAGAVGYLIGSLSSGYLVGKLYRNVDLRSLGSGSTGATNTFRTLGPGAGVLVAGLDILKGIAAVWVARELLMPANEDPRYAEALAAIGAVAGHCWPITLRGRGGRGVATGFGALLMIATPAWAIAVAAFVLAIGITRMVSVGSLASVLGALVGYLTSVAAGWLGFHPATLAFILVAGAIVYVRHVPNLQRIARGVEPRIGRPRETGA